MSNIKKSLTALILIACFNAVLCQYDRFMLSSLFRHSLVDHYRKKYNAEIVSSTSNDLGCFLNEKSFWYCFKYSNYYQKKDDVRLMWFIGIGGGHAVPVFYFQENGKKAILIADSLGQANFSLSCITSSEMCCALNIPVFIIQDRRQSDSYSCFLDALVWGKMITGKLSDGSYRIPNMLNFLFQNSENIAFQGSSERLFYVKKLPTTLLATAQEVSFLEKYRAKDHNTHDLYITSKGAYVSFNQFLNNHKGVFTFDYLRSKGVSISYYFYKYLSYKNSALYGFGVFKNFLTQKQYVSRDSLFVAYLLGIITAEVLNKM